MQYQRSGAESAPLPGRAFHHLLPLVTSLLALLAITSGCASSGTASTGAHSGATSAGPFSGAEQSRLTAAVMQAVSGETNQVQTSYAANRTLQVTVTVGWTSDITINDVDKEQERAKGICFQAQKALWTSGIAIADALVIVIGPVVGEYGEQTTDAHATAELGAGTAAGLNWATLDADSAWTRYDHVYLRSTYTFSA